MHLWTIKLSARNVSVNPSNVTEEFWVWWQISYYVTSLVGVEISAKTSRKHVCVMSNVQYILPSSSFTAKILNVGTVRSILVLNICKSRSEVNLPSLNHGPMRFFDHIGNIFWPSWSPGQQARWLFYLFWPLGYRSATQSTLWHRNLSIFVPRHLILIMSVYFMCVQGDITFCLSICYVFYLRVRPVA